MCQPMPIGVSTRWNLHTSTKRFIPRKNKTRSLKNDVMFHFQRIRPHCRIDNLYTTNRQKKIECFKFDAICSHCNTVFAARGCSYHFCPCQEVRHTLIEVDIKNSIKKSELDELIRNYIKEKFFTAIEMGECEWWDCIKQTLVSKHIYGRRFHTDTPCKMPTPERRKEWKVAWL